MAEPQRVAVFEGGGVRYLALPDAARDAVAAGQLYPAADLRAALGLAPDAQIGLVPTLATFGADDYVRQRADDEPLGDLRLSGTLSLAPAPGLRLRAGGPAGAPVRRRHRPAAPGADPVRPGRGARRRAHRRARRGSGPSTAPTAGVELRVVGVGPGRRPDGLPTRVLVRRLGRARLRRRRRRRGRRPAPLREPEPGRPPPGVHDRRGQLGHRPVRAGVLARPPGGPVCRGPPPLRPAGGRPSCSGGARPGLELGADVERQTHRLYRLDGLPLAQFFRDGDRVRTAPGLPEGGAASYDELPYAVLRPFIRTYGYTFSGLAQTDGGSSAEQFLTLGGDGAPHVHRTPRRSAPRWPAGYAEGTARLGALAVRVGLRAERYSRGGETLSDAFANRPVVRAGSLDQRPDGIGKDFAVYFAGGQRDQRVVGFRDLDGQLYDAAGQRAGIRDIEALNGIAVIDEDAAPGAAFTASPAHTTLQPRLGLPAERLARGVRVGVVRPALAPAAARALLHRPRLRDGDGRQPAGRPRPAARDRRRRPPGRRRPALAGADGLGRRLPPAAPTATSSCARRRRRCPPTRSTPTRGRRARPAGTSP